MIQFVNAHMWKIQARDPPHACGEIIPLFLCFYFTTLPIRSFGLNQHSEMYLAGVSFCRVEDIAATGMTIEVERV